MGTALTLVGGEYFLMWQPPSTTPKETDALIALRHGIGQIA